MTFKLFSFIQTILSALEFHQFSTLALAGYTAGGELHPALKTYSLDIRILPYGAQACQDCSFVLQFKLLIA